MNKIDIPRFPKMRMDYTTPRWRRKKVEREMDKEYEESYNKQNKKL